MLSNLWCGEGDLNPHEIAPASTSSYSSNPGRNYFNDLEAYQGPDDMPSYALVGTNVSHEPRTKIAPHRGES
jgi:hypothetical protein